MIEAKWSRIVLDEGFVPFPKRLLRVLPQLFSGQHAIEDLAVVLAIVDYRRPELYRGPSVDFLAFNAGMTKEMFLERVESLDERGLLVKGGSDDDLNIDIAGLETSIVQYTPDEEVEQKHQGEN